MLNTDIKLCLLNKNFKIIKKISFDKNHVKSMTYFKKKINSLIKNKNTNKFSLFSSVVPSVFNIIKNVLIKDFKIKIIELKKVNFNKIIKIKANQKQVGSDRIANAVGSYYYYKSNCIIIDFGTATTFDIVINGAYRGGIIAPGIKLSLETIPPLFSLVGFKCFLIMLIDLTLTLFCFLFISKISPVLPLSLPDIIFTCIPFFKIILKHLRSK